ncbi:GtrA family protein [Sphingobium chlorophenolicum L-1]|uniref:GtrA family protein n=1 Tax=Sphingobium chlorophenolicum L-1 TaxID=690566 RepID=F6F0S5_SPHCR|nr:GtrA family protein [Sphingobium chlorophenolicum]AEG50397.1 GtrA family protein [Sphingobium chlorophenolicum L-1]
MTKEADLHISHQPTATEHGRVEGRQLVIFTITGGIAATVNIAVRWMLSWFLFYELAVSIAYFLGMTTAFILARAFVFGASDGRWINEFGRFALVNLASFLMVMGVSVGLARLLFPAIGLHWHREDIAHIIGVVSPILLSFYAHKYFSFKKPVNDRVHG